MRVEELMTSPVLTVPADATVKEVARLLVNRRLGAVPVTDGKNRLLGIVTEADLMRLELHHDPRRHLMPVEDPPGRALRQVSDIMSAPVVAVTRDTDVADVAALMRDRHLTRIPIVDGESVVGIVSRRDLLRPLTRDDAQIVADLTEVVDELPTDTGRWRLRVRDGVVTLVPDGRPPLRKLVERLAWAVPGVVAVQIGDPADG